MKRQSKAYFQETRNLFKTTLFFRHICRYIFGLESSFAASVYLKDKITFSLII